MSNPDAPEANPEVNPQLNKNSIDAAHLARLARLQLSAEQQHATTLQLASIIDMIDAMQDVNTDGVAPMAHPLDATQRLRTDAVTESIEPSEFQAHAPETADGYYLVPRVVE